MPNVSNNGKRVFIPVALLNEVEDTIGRRKMTAAKTCATHQPKLFYPYRCDIGFDTGNAAVNLGTAFVARPDHIDTYGKYFRPLPLEKDSHYDACNLSSLVH